MKIGFLVMTGSEFRAFFLDEAEAHDYARRLPSPAGGVTVREYPSPFASISITKRAAEKDSP